jgi:hypothetical protein
MAFPGRKPLSVMVASMAPKGGKADNEPGSDDEADEATPDHEPDEAELAACQDVIDAMAKRSPEALSEALHHWMELAGYGQHEGGEE